MWEVKPSLPEARDWRRVVDDNVNSVVLAVLVFAFPNPWRWILATYVLVSIFTTEWKRGKQRGEIVEKKPDEPAKPSATVTPLRNGRGQTVVEYLAVVVAVAVFVAVVYSISGGDIAALASRAEVVLLSARR